MENLALPLLIDGLVKVYDGSIMVFKGLANFILIITRWVLVDLLHLLWEDWIIGVVDILLIIAVLYYLLGTAKKGMKYFIIILGAAIGIGILANIVR